jgi:RecJ-like exonuclease
MSNYTKKCKKCKGTGLTNSRSFAGSVIKEDNVCKECEGTGVKLMSKIEEEFDTTSEILGVKMYADDDRFIDLEEEDYEV